VRIELMTGSTVSFGREQVIRYTYAPSPTILTTTHGVRRESVRPRQYREPDFDQKYDNQTLFYDAFWAPLGRQVVLTSPPFRNLLAAIQHMKVTAEPSGLLCEFNVLSFDRHSQVWVAAPSDTRRLRLDTAIGEFDVEVCSNLSHLFRGKRVLFTKSKNNALDWVLDWARYHRDLHGADAVLIYDNGSDIYSVDDLARALHHLAGFEVTCIVNWPFKFGPQGLDAVRFWDSDYCEHGILEHGRWLFLHDATSVMSSDVDELLVSNSGESVFKAVERSWRGVISYHGIWIADLPQLSPTSPRSKIRHRDFTYYLVPTKSRRGIFFPRYTNRCPPKWTVVPKRCPFGSQWSTHRIKGWVHAIFTTDLFVYRHFRAISNNWKYDRTKRDNLDEALHRSDEVLCAAVEKVRWDI
jgi:hypothetical protein